MIRRLLIVLGLLCASAQAATITVGSFNNAGINTAVSASAAGDTIYFPAGTYTLTTPVSLACNRVYMGAGASTTHIDGTAFAASTGNVGAQAFQFPDCNLTSSSQYTTVTGLDFHVSGGIYVAGGGSGNGWYIYQNTQTAIASTVPDQTSYTGEAFIFFDGGLGDSLTNVSIHNNTVGDSSSCTTVNSSIPPGNDPPVHGSYDDEQGFCGVVYEHIQYLTNFSFKNNLMQYVEEGLKFHQLQDSSCTVSCQQSTMNTTDVEDNYIVHFHRIAIELQPGVQAGSYGLNVAHNVIAEVNNPYYGTFGISNPCCTNASPTGSATPGTPPVNDQDNLVYTSDGANIAPYAIEYWGWSGSYAQNNLIQGQWPNGIEFGYGPTDGSWYIINNTLQGNFVDGSPIADEECSGACTPTQSGNTITSTIAQVQSVAPTISSTGGATGVCGVSGGNATVTLSDSGQNTSIYYTTNGTTPTVASALYSAPFVVTSGTVVKAIGMWGQAPQPTSYTSPYGYYPSDPTIYTVP